MEWLEVPTLSDPLALVAFEGWNDAGDAASGAVDYVRTATDARLIGIVDHDDFNDHQVTRPHVATSDSGERVIDWPDTRFYAASTGGRDIVLVLGEEPRLKWKRFSRLVSAALQELGTGKVITFGAFLGQVPHSLDVPVIGSYDLNARQAHDLLPSRYEGPTGIIGVLNQWLNKDGFEAGSLWAATPHYLQSTNNPKASKALLSKAQAIGGFEIAMGDLDVEVAEWEARVAAAVSENDELAGYLREMEEILADADDDDDDDDSVSLLEEIERFLRNQ